MFARNLATIKNSFFIISDQFITLSVMLFHRLVPDFRAFSLKVTWVAANLFLFAHNLVLSVLGIHERKELKITKVYLSLSSYDLRVASQKGNFYFNFLYCCVV